MKIKKSQAKITVVCDYDGGFVMPHKCLACGRAVTDKKWQIKATNFLRTRQINFKFPICDDCAEAGNNYINTIPTNVAIVVILALSLFSMFYAPNGFSKGLYNILGIIWFAIVIGFATWLNMRAVRKNTDDRRIRAKNLKTAILIKKIKEPRKNKKGEAIIEFGNMNFGKAFRSLNRGKIM